MYYVRHGSIPQQRHTQHRQPDGSLYAEELFGVEGFSGRSSLLYHLVPPTRTHKIEPVREIKLEAADEKAHRHHLTKTGGGRAEGRRDLRPRSRCTSTATSSSGSSARPRRCPRTSSTGTASRTRCCSSTRARASATRSSDRCGTGPATTSSCPSARPGGSSPTRAQPSGSCTSRRRRRSSRRSATGTTTASSSSIRRTRSATSTRPRRSRRATSDGEFVVHVRSTDRLTAYHFAHHPFDVVGWDGYLWPFRFNIANFQPITGRVHQPPPGPPDVPGAELRGLLVRAPEVRLPPARDPGAVQPLEHQQRRGHLLRRRQLHEPPRGRHRLVHPPPGRDPARAPSGLGGGVDRQGGDRGARGDGRHVPSAATHEGGDGARRRPLPVLVDPAGRRGGSRLRARRREARRRSPTSSQTCRLAPRTPPGWRRPPADRCPLEPGSSGASGSRRRTGPWSGGGRVATPRRPPCRRRHRGRTPGHRSRMGR